MPDSHDRTENANAQERAREALERGVAEVKTPEQARHALDSLEKIAGDLREEDVARAGPDAAPEQQAAAIEEAEDVAAAAKPASVIATAAVQSASAAPGGKSIVDESVTQALGGGGAFTRRRRTRVGAAATCARNFLNGSIRCRQWMPSLSAD